MEVGLEVAPVPQSSSQWPEPLLLCPVLPLQKDTLLGACTCVPDAVGVSGRPR